MASYITRNAYFPSAGVAASSPAFDSWWTDTSIAQRLAGVWDNPSNTADALTVLAGSVTSSTPTIILLAQYVFPAFGRTISGIASHGGSATFNFSGSPIALGKYVTSSTTHLTVQLQVSVRVFDGSGNFKFYMGAQPLTSTGGWGSPYDAVNLRGEQFGWHSVVNTQLLLPTDVLVVEVGVRVSADWSTPTTYTVTWQFGDGHASYDVHNGTAVGNSGFGFEWWGTVYTPPPPFSGFPPGSEFQVVVTNLAVAGANAALKVAGPGSVRIEETSAWAVRSGYWEDATAVGWWSQGRAIRAAATGAAVTVETHCGATHDIWIGTRLDADCGILSATLDGGTAVTLDCYVAAGSAGPVRRKLFGGVAAGKHAVAISVSGTKNASSSGWYLYFDFLECAVPGDVPDAPEVRTDFGLSVDYDTDHGYMLSPQRLVWAIQKTGLVGEIDHYAGVFWWTQRKRVGGSFPQAVVTFGGTWASGDVAWLHIGGTDLGKTVFPADTTSTIAAHFAYFINATLVGVWASAVGAVLTITTRSTGANWMYTFSTSKTSAAGTIGVTGDLSTGAAEGTWTIDPTVTPVLSRGFRDWHADYFALLEAAGIGVVAAFSDELVNTPDASGAVWVQRYKDGTAVLTATGFGALESSQVAFSAGPAAYLAAAYAAMAGLMVTAGLPARLQCGEVLWWYQAGGSPASMAFYDADTAAAAVVALGRALATFATPNDDPAVNAYADANFLRARLKAYVDGVRAAVLVAAPAAVFELLWPMDVDDPDTARLMRYVNLPAEWTARSGSGWDTFACEGFQYGEIEHNVDKARRAAAYPFGELSWDRAHCRYLMGWFNAGWPWVREYRAARATMVSLIKAWAMDHLCLMGWTLPLPAASEARAVVRTPVR